MKLSGAGHDFRFDTEIMLQQYRDDIGSFRDEAVRDENGDHDISLWLHLFTPLGGKGGEKSADLLRDIRNLVFHQVRVHRQ